MAKGSEIGYKRKTRNKVQLKKKGSDESDEDYMVSEDEVFNLSEDEYCSSFADDESEDSLGEFDEEEEWLEKKVKKAVQPRVQKGFLGRKKNRITRQRRKMVSYNEEGEDYEDDGFITVKQGNKNTLSPRKENEDDDIDDLFGGEEDDFSERKSRISRTRYGSGSDEKLRKKNKVLYREAEEEDGDYDDSDDEEFTPDEIDGLDDEIEETPVTKNRVSRPRMQVARITKGRRTKRYPKRTKRKNNANEQILSKKRKSVHDKESRDDKYPSWKKTRITKQSKRRRKLTVNSDSDFVSSGPSDYEFTISEEEREQVREASEFCKRLRSNLRSSDSLNMVNEEETVPSERKRLGRKGKEKVVELTIEVGKQVCGICLSEEGIRTVRGILNSCSHYFCFACIMEWSKVESRCPLCKQRFGTITRTSRADGGLDSRDAVIAVPERDQVYQPSEEELRGYLDPYESVLCTECQQGGDDAHMLLCDLCDSPAHTYCVGLGHEVPDGNWYCDGCRPTALASQAQTPTDQRTSNNSFASSSPPVARETFDLNEMYVPDTPLTQVSEPSPLLRNPNGDSFATSPTYGSGAFTLFERRRIQRQIHQLLNNRSRRSERSNDVASVSSTTLFGSQIVSIAPNNGVVPVRASPESGFDQGRFSDYGTPLMYSREGISPRFGSLMGQRPHDQGSTSMAHGFVGNPHNEFGGGHQQLQPCSGRSINGVGGASVSSFQFREATVPSRTLQGSPHPPL